METFILFQESDWNINCFTFVHSGNGASIFLLTRKELNSFFHQLLSMLCAFDMVYLTTMFLESIRFDLSPCRGLCTLFSPVIKYQMTSKIWYCEIVCFRLLGLDSNFQTMALSYFLYPLNSICLTGSIYMTMIIGFERWSVITF